MLGQHRANARLEELDASLIGRSQLGGFFFAGFDSAAPAVCGPATALQMATATIASKNSRRRGM
jgi:hypothetical protein